MISQGPISARPFSAGTDVRVYMSGLFETSLNASLEYIVYCATQQYVTLPGDSRPSQPFRGTLSEYTFKRSIIGGDIGVFATGDGTLVIDNVDGFYDFLPQIYGIDGRDIRLDLGRVGDSYDTHFPLARLTASNWLITDDAVSITLEDYTYKLKVPTQPNVYGGTGGRDGGDDLTGKRIPIALGAVLNVTPALVVANQWIFQVNDGPVHDITAVYDRGSALTKGANYATFALLAAATVPGGSYATCLAEGFFRLQFNVSPAGTITADVEGDNADGYVETSADIVRWLVRNKTAIVDPDGLSLESISALNALQPAPVNYWVGPDDTTMVADAIANIMRGIGGWAGFNRVGQFEVKCFSAPAGAPVAYFTRLDIIGPIRREALPSGLAPPPWRWRVAYQHVWTPQTDLAGIVTADRKAFVAVADRLAEASAETIKVDHPFAPDVAPVASYFSVQADAQAEADRLLALYRTVRFFYRMTLPRRALRLALGDVIQVTYPRFDLTLGRLMTVVEISEDVTFGDNKIDTVEVVAYG